MTSVVRSLSSINQPKGGDMSNNRKRALLRDLAMVTVLAVAALMIIGSLYDRYHGAEIAARRDRAAEEVNRQVVNNFPRLSTTPTTSTAPAVTVPAIPETTVVETIPAMNPSTTTAPVMLVPTNDELNARYNDLGINMILDVPSLEKGPFSLSNADMTAVRPDGKDDVGYEALSLGPALFLSSGYRTGGGGERTPSNDFSVPGGGGKVLIGGHRTTGGGWAPFEHIDRVQAGDQAVITTEYGTFTYRIVPDASAVLSGCDNSSSDSPTNCRVDNTVDAFYGAIDSYAGQKESLFLFSCDDRGAWRLLLVFELVSAVPA
jgi:hypothetical protein